MKFKIENSIEVRYYLGIRGFTISLVNNDHDKT